MYSSNFDTDSWQGELWIKKLEKELGLPTILDIS